MTTPLCSLQSSQARAMHGRVGEGGAGHVVKLSTELGKTKTNHFFGCSVSISRVPPRVACACCLKSAFLACILSTPLITVMNQVQRKGTLKATFLAECACSSQRSTTGSNCPSSASWLQSLKMLSRSVAIPERKCA